MKDKKSSLLFKILVRGEQSDTPFTEKLIEPPDCRRMERNASFPTIFPKKEVQLIGTEGTRLLREKRV